jgi:putative spermidine/putrescine transport system permease protein
MNAYGPRRLMRWAHAGLVGLILLYLIAPALIVIPMSFMGESMRRFPAAEFSLGAYRRFFDQPAWTGATIFSFEMAAVVMVVSVAIAAATAYGILLVRPAVRRMISVVALLPVIVPTVVFAISIYWLLAQFRLLGTFAGFVLANLVLALPYAILMLRNGIEALDSSLIRAAAVLGARPARIVFKVVIPLLMPALAAAALFSFLTAFDEVVVAQFISGPSAVPVSKQMWDGILFRWDPAISAISTMQIAITIVVLIVVGLMRRRRAKQIFAP